MIWYFVSLFLSQYIWSEKVHLSIVVLKMRWCWKVNGTTPDLMVVGGRRPSQKITWLTCKIWRNNFWGHPDLPPPLKTLKWHAALTHFRKSKQMTKHQFIYFYFLEAGASLIMIFKSHFLHQLPLYLHCEKK